MDIKYIDIRYIYCRKCTFHCRYEELPKSCPNCGSGCSQFRWADWMCFNCRSARESCQPPIRGNICICGDFKPAYLRVGELDIMVLGNSEKIPHLNRITLKHLLDWI